MPHGATVSPKLAQIYHNDEGRQRYLRDEQDEAADGQRLEISATSEMVGDSDQAGPGHCECVVRAAAMMTAVSLGPALKQSTLHRGRLQFPLSLSVPRGVCLLL